MVCSPQRELSPRTTPPISPRVLALREQSHQHPTTRMVSGAQIHKHRHEVSHKNLIQFMIKDKINKIVDLIMKGDPRTAKKNLEVLGHLIGMKEFASPNRHELDKLKNISKSIFHLHIYRYQAKKHGEDPMIEDIFCEKHAYILRLHRSAHLKQRLTCIPCSLQALAETAVRVLSKTSKPKLSLVSLAILLGGRLRDFNLRNEEGLYTAETVLSMFPSRSHIHEALGILFQYHLDLETESCIEMEFFNVFTQQIHKFLASTYLALMN